MRVCYLDLTVFFIYLAGFFVVGSIFSRLVKNTSDMFAAGRRSPWWMSGLSAFMTMFSAGTFVVWGGIAYKWGLVAISINMCYGVAALLAGRYVAARWHGLGVSTPAEYIRLRFGSMAVHFYTWTMMTYRIVGVAVSLYALSVLLVALMPLAESNPFRDPQTGNLGLVWAVLLFGSVIIIYTMAGGLWAVLVTDVLQFVILSAAVAFVIPLMFLEAGGVAASIQSLPEGFFRPVTSELTWLFLAGWCTVHFFMVGAEWAFVQRFICVPAADDARRSTRLFGILYLISPLFWMLPPMLYRAVDANADPEQAYVLACQAVLPAGMMGMVLAAMFSATASMVSSQLNVFAGVLTHDFYRPLIRPGASQGNLVFVGRCATFVLGTGLVAIALCVPRMGGAENVILSITSLLVVPLLAPSIWGLFSRRIDQRSVWLTALPSFVLGILFTFGFAPSGWFARFDGLGTLIEWLQANSRSVEVAIGVILPVCILAIVELSSDRATSPGWIRVAALSAGQGDAPRPQPSTLPAYIVAGCVALCAMMIALLALADRSHWLLQLAFATAMLLIAAAIAWRTRRQSANPS